PGDRYAERRARHVVEPEPIAEGNRARLAAVLTADTDLQCRLDAPPALDRDPHQLADAVLVEHLERIALDHAVLEVAREKLAFGVIARKAERGLRQVVRAEREEVGFACDLVGTHARARELD